MLENQARQLVKEASSTGTSAGSEEWAGVALPLVRRIFAEFAAKEFVSVQPMNLPSGLIFYLDFKYGTAQPGFDADNLNRTGDPFGSPNADDSMFGVTTTSGDPSGGLYGAGRFGYSINETASIVSAATGSQPTAAQVNGDSTYSGSSDYKMITVNVPTEADLYAVRSFILRSGSAQTNIVPVQAFSSIDSNYTASFVVTTTQAAAISSSIGAGNLRLVYSKQPTDITRGDFEDNKGAFIVETPRVPFAANSGSVNVYKAVVAELVKKHFPDFRRVVNELQRYSKFGEINQGILAQITSTKISDIVKHIAAKDFGSIRKWAATEDIDPTTVFRMIYDNMYDVLKPNSIPKAVCILADYQYKNAFVADPEINMVACLTELMVECEFQ